MSIFTHSAVIPCHSLPEWKTLRNFLIKHNVTWISGTQLTHTPLSFKPEVRTSYIHLEQYSRNYRIGHAISAHPDNHIIYNSVNEFISAHSTSNEQIFIQFLKHHRKYSAFKRNFARRSDPTQVVNINRAILYSFSFSSDLRTDWGDLHEKWVGLINHFNLKGTLDYSKII